MRGRANDHEDFLRATLRHADLLHTLALRLALHPADAADIVQEIYLRAYAAWGRRRPTAVAALDALANAVDRLADTSGPPAGQKPP